MAGSTIRNINQAKMYADNLRRKIIIYASHIDTVNEKIRIFMQGDGTDSYWQGEAAYAWCEKAIGVNGLKGIIANYNLTFIEFKNFAKKIERAEIKNEKVATQKSVVTSMINQCNGAKYTVGVPANKDEKNIPAVLSTVSADVVNDDQTNESFRAYNNLKQALSMLIQDYNELDKIWNSIQSIVTGDLNKEAKQRIIDNGKKRKRINDLIVNLEEEYLGDILFS